MSCIHLKPLISMRGKAQSLWLSFLTFKSHVWHSFEIEWETTVHQKLQGSSGHLQGLNWDGRYSWRTDSYYKYCRAQIQLRSDLSSTLKAVFLKKCLILFWIQEAFQIIQNEFNDPIAFRFSFLAIKYNMMTCFLNYYDPWLGLFFHQSILAQC